MPIPSFEVIVSQSSLRYDNKSEKSVNRFVCDAVAVLQCVPHYHKSILPRILNIHRARLQNSEARPRQTAPADTIFFRR